MGGIGSGNFEVRNSAKNVVEDYRALDVLGLHRGGSLEAGSLYRLIWSPGKASETRIRMQVEEDRIILRYYFRRGGGPWEEIEEPVPLAWTPCHFGGRRPWLLCPGIRDGKPCGQRVAKLYLVSKYFLCRLAYRSTREDRETRLAKQESRILRRLGGSGNRWSPLPGRPGGMHRETYLRLLEKATSLRLQSLAEMRHQFDLLESRIARCLSRSKKKQ